MANVQDYDLEVNEFELQLHCNGRYGIRTIYTGGSNKVFSSMFFVGFPVWHESPEES